MERRDFWPGEDHSGLPSWDERIRALLPPSVDPTQLTESLRLTPTQRLERLQELLNAVTALQARR
jgi:hypothetical protein